VNGYNISTTSLIDPVDLMHQKLPKFACLIYIVVDIVSLFIKLMLIGKETSEVLFINSVINDEENK